MNNINGIDVNILPEGLAGLEDNLEKIFLLRLGIGQQARETHTTVIIAASLEEATALYKEAAEGDAASGKEFDWFSRYALSPEGWKVLASAMPMQFGELVQIPGSIVSVSNSHYPKGQYNGGVLSYRFKRGESPDGIVQVVTLEENLQIARERALKLGPAGLTDYSVVKKGVTAFIQSYIRRSP